MRFVRKYLKSVLLYCVIPIAKSGNVISSDNFVGLFLKLLFHFQVEL